MCEIGWRIEAVLPGPAIVLSQANGTLGSRYTAGAAGSGRHEPALADQCFHLPAPVQPGVEYRRGDGGREVRAALSRWQLAVIPSPVTGAEQPGQGRRERRFSPGNDLPTAQAGASDG